MTRILLAVLLFLALPAWARAGEVPLVQVLSWKKKVLWVDARTPAEFQAAHIPGAIALNEQNWHQGLPALLDAWSPESRIVVYCDSRKCDSSKLIAERLNREAGLENVFFLKDGWLAWLTHQNKR